MSNGIKILLYGICIILLTGLIIYLIPVGQAANRDRVEQKIIDDYLQENSSGDGVYASSSDMEEQESSQSYEPDPEVAEEEEYVYSDVTNRGYVGEVDSILIIDKINLKKAIIRSADNDYNLERYFFVTADMDSELGEDNYVIYGHCSTTYGHSFNRLDELEVGDEFRLIKGYIEYCYIVNNVTRELRENSAMMLVTDSNTVQLVSCEKKKAEGYKEKRLIIVTGELSSVSRIFI